MGIIENVLVKVGGFIYLVDFIVLETQPISNPKSQILIILGQPFLPTSNALMNCWNGMLKLTFGNMTTELNVFRINNQSIHSLENPNVLHIRLGPKTKAKSKSKKSNKCKKA